MLYSFNSFYCILFLIFYVLPSILFIVSSGLYILMLIFPGIFHGDHGVLINRFNSAGSTLFLPGLGMI